MFMMVFSIISVVISVWVVMHPNTLKYIYIILVFSSLDFSFFLIMISTYLFKHFNFINVYDGIFNNFSCYKCLGSNASKYLKIMHKSFLKYASKHK